MELADLEKLKVVKEFHVHNHADRVYLLKGGVVKKHYPTDVERNYRFFDKEIEMMQHLEKCPFVAKLLHYDRETLTIYMTYCGRTPAKTPDNLRKVYQTAKTLHQKWGVVRHDKAGKIVYDLYLPNTGIKDGKIYLFDLASDKWSIERGAREKVAKMLAKKELKKQLKKQAKLDQQERKIQKKLLKIEKKLNKTE